MQSTHLNQCPSCNTPAKKDAMWEEFKQNIYQQAERKKTKPAKAKEVIDTAINSFTVRCECEMIWNLLSQSITTITSSTLTIYVWQAVMETWDLKGESIKVTLGYEPSAIQK